MSTRSPWERRFDGIAAASHERFEPKPVPIEKIPRCSRCLKLAPNCECGKPTKRTS